MKAFNVTYHFTVYDEATVTAKSTKEAMKKLRDVLKYIEVDDIWEVETCRNTAKKSS